MTLGALVLALALIASSLHAQRAFVCEPLRDWET